MKSKLKYTAVALSTALLLSACATTRMDAQWTNPDYQGRSARGGSVLVACEARELTLQRICEQQLGAAVSARGATPTLSSQLAPTTTQPSGVDPYLSAAKKAGARAIVRMTLSSGAPLAVDGGPTIGIGVGGSSGGYRSGGSFGGIGIGFPIGGSRVSQAYGADTALIDVTNGATIWSGRASSSNADDVTGQITQLAQTTVEALQNAGLL